MDSASAKDTLDSEMVEARGDVHNAGERLARRKAWQPYIDATLGFRNYWYPALYSREIAEGEIKGETLLGELIAFKRVDGRVYAFEDRCAHRGVRLTARPECYTKNTISCWYHGFTYNVKTGALEVIITQPDVKMKVSLRTYPVEERNGIVFVFIGDTAPPPPLEWNAPPGFLAAGLATRGIRRVINSNWRHGVENSFDYSHIYIHRNDGLMKARHIPLPFANGVSLDPGGLHLAESETGLNGIYVHTTGDAPPIYEVEIEGVRVRTPRAPLPGQEVPLIGLDTSIWMPGVLRVDPWPAPGMTIYAWNVPVDEKRHQYWAVIGKPVANDAEAQQFYDEFDHLWYDLSLTKGFNDTDVFAREQLERPYAEDDWWYREATYRPDIFILQWRLLCTRRHRGIQKRRGTVNPGR